MNLRFLPVILFTIVLASGCTSSKKLNHAATGGSISGLRFVNEYVVPNGQELRGTLIGGLSGIDYDARRDQYYLICDDPSSKGAARFYTARLFIHEGIDSVHITDVTILLDAAGQPYPDITKDRIHSADLEAMRYDPTRNEMIWSSEGQRNRKGDKLELQDPAVVITDRAGRHKDSFALPPNMHIQPIEKGPRHNSVFEGLAFDEKYRHVYVSVEEPLYEDGPRAGTGDSTAWVRLIKFNRNTRRQVAQYAYQLDAVPYAANPAGAFKVNGISDILYLGKGQFIVIERGFSSGRPVSDVRIYLADARGAEDVSGNPSLAAQPARKPVTKKLLLDMNSLGRFVDNIEGVTFGPRLANGHWSLVFVADNNFDNKEKNQFFLFEVLP
ncbi:MAG: esterase-like activity of phytase family protein [Chitinophagaceae bacterium]